MEFKVVELVATVLVVGSLVLLGLRIISFEQALTLISIAISLLTGKYLSKYEDWIIRGILGRRANPSRAKASQRIDPNLYSRWDSTF